MRGAAGRTCLADIAGAQHARPGCRQSGPELRAGSRPQPLTATVPRPARSGFEDPARGGERIARPGLDADYRLAFVVRDLDADGKIGGQRAENPREIDSTLAGQETCAAPVKISSSFVLGVGTGASQICA